MKKVKDFFEKHFLLSDTILVAAVFYLCFGIFKKTKVVFIDLLIFNNADSLFPIFLNSCITLLGFLITGVSITMIFLKDEKLKRLEEYGHFQSIINIYISSIRVCAILTILSVCGLLTDANLYVTHITSLFLFILLARIARCVWIIEQITKIIYKKDKS